MADGVRDQGDGDGDEIDLRAYAIVLWRRRALVIGVTAAAIIVAGLVSQFTPRTYEATSVLMVARPPYQVGGPPDPGNPGPKIGTTLPQDIPMETVVALAKHPSILDVLANRVYGAHGPLGVQTRASAIRNTGLVELRVRGRNPREVARVADVWASVVLAKSQALFASTARNSLTFFEGRMRESNRTLREAEQSQQNFMAASRMALLQIEMKALMDQIAEYRSRLVDVSISIAQARTELTQTERQLAGQPRTFVLTKSLDSDPLIMTAARDQAKRDITQLSHLSLRSEELNPVYLSLAQARTTLIIRVRALGTEQAQILMALDRLNGTLDRARQEFATEQLTAARVTEAVTMARQTYDVLRQRSEESRVATAADSAPVRIVADAMVPQTPVGPKRVLLLALAGMLGAVVGTLSAFIAEAITTGSGQRQIVRGGAPAQPIS